MLYCDMHGVERTNINVLHIAEQPLKTHLGGKLEMLLMLGGAPLLVVQDLWTFVLVC